MNSNTLDYLLDLGDLRRRRDGLIQIYISDFEYKEIMDMVIHSTMKYIEAVSKDILSCEIVEYVDMYARFPFICGSYNDGSRMVCVLKESEKDFKISLIGNSCRHVTFKCVSDKADVKTTMQKYFNSLSDEEQCFIALSELSVIRKYYD